MNINKFGGFAYDKESKAIGAIAGLDLIKKTVTILTDDEDLIVAKSSNVEVLRSIGDIGNIRIIDHDVVETVDGKQYEVELQEDGVNVLLHLLDKKLQRVEKGDFFNKEDIDQLEPYVSFVGNLYELQSELPQVDFNINIVREHVNGETTYYYAGNNEETEEIDLIKVVFVGHQLLEEEKYERTTISYDTYINSIENGTLKEVSKYELLNYVTGLTYRGGNKPSIRPIDEEHTVNDELAVEEDEEADIDLDICEDCGEHIDECDCRGW